MHATKVASSEGAVGAIADLHERGLITPEAKFVPAAAGTMFTPTSPLNRSNLEKLLHRYLNEDDPEVSFIRAQPPLLQSMQPDVYGLGFTLPLCWDCNGV
eukprot:COSAG02_NODE_4321_length_5506_cov_63.368599_7_plen_100_part_00